MPDGRSDYSSLNIALARLGPGAIHVGECTAHLVTSVYLRLPNADGNGWTDLPIGGIQLADRIAAQLGMLQIVRGDLDAEIAAQIEYGVHIGPPNRFRLAHRPDTNR